MKLKSLILGSVAAAGLSTAGFAADLGVLTSLDVCDSLGISGLTISSADNCLAISGKVSYEFNWGNYDGKWAVAFPYADAQATPPGRGTIMPGVTAAVVPQAGIWVEPDGVTMRVGQIIGGQAETEAEMRTRLGIPATTPLRAVAAPVLGRGPATGNDWSSKVETWLKFVGTAASDFGSASATIKLKGVGESAVTNLIAGTPAATNNTWTIDEAFVQIGDATTIMAGKKGSIANFDDDEPFNWLGLFNSDAVDKGVMFAKDHPKTGGHVIQIVSDLGNGVKVKAGLENLDSAAAPIFNGGWTVGGPAAAGTLVGVIEYAGEGITAHVTGLAGGILDGVVEDWAVHAGVTGTFDAFKVRAAGAYSANSVGHTYWNVLGSVEGTFDMFTIALSGEADGGYNGLTGVTLPTQVGVGGSVTATVTEGVKINLGGRWFDSNASTAGNEGYQVAARLVAAITETIEVGGEVGVYGHNFGAGGSDFYGKADLAWKPGGQFESSLGAEIHQNGAYKVTFKASKEFK